MANAATKKVVMHAVLKMVKPATVGSTRVAYYVAKTWKRARTTALHVANLLAASYVVLKMWKYANVDCIKVLLCAVN